MYEVTNDDPVCVLMFSCCFVICLFVKKRRVRSAIYLYVQGGEGRGDMIHGHAVWEACGMVFEEDGRGDGPRV